MLCAHKFCARKVSSARRHCFSVLLAMAALTVGSDTMAGTVLGTVTAIPNFGASDLLEVRDGRSGDTYLYPFTKAVVPTIDIAGGFVVIEVPVDAEPGEEEPD